MTGLEQRKREPYQMELNDLLQRRNQLTEQLLLDNSLQHRRAVRSELTTIEGALAYLRHHRGLKCPTASLLHCQLEQDRQLSPRS